MRNREAPFSAAMIAMILATGTALGGSISVSASLPDPSPRILAASPGKVDRAAAAEAEADRNAEPAAMGFLGLGISGIVALRRLRKLFS